MQTLSLLLALATSPSPLPSASVPPSTLNASKTLSPAEILKKTDDIRSPDQSYLMEVSVESPNQSLNRFEIAIGGKDQSLIRTLEPKREVGKNFLMIKEDMWAFIPNLNRAIRVSLNQKLTGQAANGDISRMRWYGDYDPRLERNDGEFWVLILKAARRGLTYDQIRIWIRKDNFRPHRGEYLSSAGTLLKKIYFEEFSEIGGSIRPTRMRLENALKANEHSILRIIKMEPKNFGSQHFTQENLR